MSISRREFGVLGAAALAFHARHANAGERDVFVFGQDLPANLDPHQILDLGMTGYPLNTYDNLYRYEDNPPKMQPWLAISHTSSPDGLVWDFKLRQGVKFHDGSELAADDVVYSVQRLLGIGRAPAAPFLPTLKPESVNAPDRYTVRFTLDRPYGPFFSMLPMVFIVNPRAVKPHEEAGDWGARWLASNEAGSGAYRLIPSSYLPLEHADVEKYDDHFYSWRENSQAIKKVEWRPTKVTSTRVLALLNSTIDMTDSFLPVDQVERIDKAPNAHVAKNVTMRLLVIRMNNTKPPFDNINARKCFAHAFNYTGFIEEIVKGNALRNPAPLPNNIWGYPKDVAGYDFDLAKAKEYFQKAVAEGAPMRRPIELHVQQPLEQTIQAGQLFQSDLASIGINPKMVNDTGTDSCCPSSCVARSTPSRPCSGF